MNHYRLIGISILFIILSTKLSSQCTNQLALSSEGASINGSGTAGLCFLCQNINPSNIINANMVDYATVVIPVGVGGYGYIRIDLGQDYSAGSRVGWIIDLNGGVAGLINSATLIARNDGSIVETVSGSDLINILGIGGGLNINAIFCSEFDEIEIRLGSLAAAIATYHVYLAYVTEDCSFPVPCGAIPTPEVCGDGIDNDGNGQADNEDNCSCDCE